MGNLRANFVNFLYQLIENVYNTYMNYVSTVKYDVDIYNMYTYNELHWMYFELTPISEVVLHS